MAKINEEAELAAKLNTVAIGLNHVNTAHEAALNAARLKSIARSISRFDEAFCNREVSNREQARNVRLNDAARAILHTYGLKMERNHDPRGYSIYINFPDGSYNTMGGRETGWGI